MRLLSCLRREHHAVYQHRHIIFLNLSFCSSPPNKTSISLLASSLIYLSSILKCSATNAYSLHTSLHTIPTSSVCLVSAAFHFPLFPFNRRVGLFGLRIDLRKVLSETPSSSTQRMIMPSLTLQLRQSSRPSFFSSQRSLFFFFFNFFGLSSLRPWIPVSNPPPRPCAHNSLHMITVHPDLGEFSRLIQPHRRLVSVKAKLRAC